MKVEFWVPELNTNVLVLALISSDKPGKLQDLTIANSCFVDGVEQPVSVIDRTLGERGALLKLLIQDVQRHIDERTNS